MSQPSNLELDDFASPELASVPTYYGNIDRSHKSSQPEARERLIPRKPLLNQATVETSIHPTSPGLQSLRQATDFHKVMNTSKGMKEMYGCQGSGCSFHGGSYCLSSVV